MNRRSQLVVVILVMVLMTGFGAAWYSGQITQGVATLAYAVETGQAEASKQWLAKHSFEFESVFEHAAQAVKPSVVSISTVRTVHLPHRHPFMEPHWPRLFEDFFGERFFHDPFFDAPRQHGYTERGLGSGVIVSSDGYILTNNHVIAGADQLTVRLSDNRRYEAEVVGTDSKSDLAVIRIDANDLKPATLGSSADLRVGQWVMAVGSPFGLDHTVTAGIVSAKGRANVGVADYEDFIQTDAAINQGNSGGPLINLRAEVVGINTAILSRSGGYQGIGLAIPSDMARQIMESLIDGGEVVRGWLGVLVQSLTPEMAGSFGYEGTDGVLIADVTPASPAEAAGLQSGDIIMQLNGQPVADATPFRNRIAQTAPGTEVQLRIWRDGETLDVSVQIAQLPDEDAALQPLFKPTQQLGLELADPTERVRRQFGLPDRLEGAVITAVAPHSPAARAGLRPGTVILDVQGQRVRNASEAERALAAAEREDKVIRLRTEHDGMRRFVLLQRP